MTHLARYLTNWGNRSSTSSWSRPSTFHVSTKSSFGFLLRLGLVWEGFSRGSSGESGCVGAGWSWGSLSEGGWAEAGAGSETAWSWGLTRASLANWAPGVCVDLFHIDIDRVCVPVVALLFSGSSSSVWVAWVRWRGGGRVTGSLWWFAGTSFAFLALSFHFLFFFLVAVASGAARLSWDWLGSIKLQKLYYWYWYLIGLTVRVDSELLRYCRLTLFYYIIDILVSYQIKKKSQI